MLTVEFGPHYKYAKHPSPIFQSSTLAAAGQFHKMFESSEFSGSLGGGIRIATWEKDAWTCEWNRRKPSRCYGRQLSSTNAKDVYIFSLTFCVADTRGKFPGVILSQAANFCQSGRRSLIPVSERERERAWVRERGYSLADPAAGAGQSSSSTCLQFPDIDVSKVSLVGELSRRRHTSVHFSQYRYLV